MNEQIERRCWRCEGSEVVVKRTLYRSRDGSLQPTFAGHEPCVCLNGLLKARQKDQRP